MAFPEHASRWRSRYVEFATAGDTVNARLQLARVAKLQTHGTQNTAHGGRDVL
jgi:hypothetical protein